MAFKASDGSEFGSGRVARRHDRRLAAQAPAPTDADQDSDQDQPKDITQDPQAMECVDKLKSMGYTADDVAQAFDADSGSDQSQGSDDGSAATDYANVQLPGLS
jgi:hypothetical protein